MTVDRIRGEGVAHIDAGTVNAVIDDIDFKTTKFGLAYQVTYRCPDFDDFKLTALLNTATTAGSQMGRLIKALTGRVLPEGEDLDPNELIGRRVIMRVSVAESGYNKVEAVWPAPDDKPSGGASKAAATMPSTSGNGAATAAIPTEQLEAFQQFLQQQAEAEARIPAPADQAVVDDAPHPADGPA